MRFFAIAFAFLASLSACAQEAAEKFEEGVHYTVLSSPVRTITPGKIEVTEAFSYGCGHCFKFEPLIKAWDKQKADDVALVKLPVVWNQNPQSHKKMQLMARTMYTGEALGISDKINELVFDQLHNKRKHLDTEDDAAAIFATAGINKEKFTKTFNSFGVSSQVQQAESRTRSMDIRGTPQLIVDGRYSISAKRDLGHSGMLEVANFLIEKIRAEKK